MDKLNIYEKDDSFAMRHAEVCVSTLSELLSSMLGQR